MTWPHRGKVQLASDNTHLADLRTLPMPRADHALYRPISAQAQLEPRLFALAMIFVSRLESRSRQERVAPVGSVRRNISRTC